jgi:hypothetical protein
MFKPLTVLHAGWCIDAQRGLAAEQSAENFSAPARTSLSNGVYTSRFVTSSA